MRLYGGRLIKSKVRRTFEERKEMRNAVIYSVSTTNRWCWVQIQGSDTQIKAFYPENWEKTPNYLRPGNTVLITHPGGNKGRIEIVGHGLLKPTPVAGTGPPEPGAPGDSVLTGCNLSPTAPNSMAIFVNPGTYRIDNITYSIVGLEMDRADVEMDREDLILDEVADSVTLAAASPTYYRYDSIVAGTDGDAHVEQGDYFAYDADPIPDPPEAPADHVRCGWILVYPGMTEVSVADINRLFLAPTPTELRMVIDDQELAWGENSATITVSVRDQYGNLKTQGGTGYYITLSWEQGGGTLSYGGSSATASQTLSFYMAATADITYTRSSPATDASPIITANESITGFEISNYINNYDSSGYLML